jgi:hypothetical protein
MKTSTFFAKLLIKLPFNKKGNMRKSQVCLQWVFSLINETRVQIVVFYALDYLGSADKMATMAFSSLAARSENSLSRSSLAFGVKTTSKSSPGLLIHRGTLERDSQK